MPQISEGVPRGNPSPRLELKSPAPDVLVLPPWLLKPLLGLVQTHPRGPQAPWCPPRGARTSPGLGLVLRCVPRNAPSPPHFSCKRPSSLSSRTRVPPGPQGREPCEKAAFPGRGPGQCCQTSRGWRDHVNGQGKTFGVHHGSDAEHPQSGGQGREKQTVTCSGRVHIPYFAGCLSCLVSLAKLVWCGPLSPLDRWGAGPREDTSWGFQQGH